MKQREKNHKKIKSIGELWNAFRKLSVSLTGRESRKNTWKGQKLSKFEEHRTSIDPSSIMSPEHMKDKEIYTRDIIIKLLKTSDKEKVLKAARQDLRCAEEQN